MEEFNYQNYNIQNLFFSASGIPSKKNITNLQTVHKESDSQPFTLPTIVDVYLNEIKPLLQPSPPSLPISQPSEEKVAKPTEIFTDKSTKLCTKSLQVNLQRNDSSEKPAHRIKTLNATQYKCAKNVVEVKLKDQINPTTSYKNLLQNNDTQLGESIPYLSRQAFLQYEKNMLLSKEEEVKQNEEALLKICQDWEVEYAAEQKLKREEEEKLLREQRIKRFEQQQKQIRERRQQQLNRYRSLHPYYGQKPCGSGYSPNIQQKRKQTSTKHNKKNNNKKKGSSLSDSSSSESSSFSESSESDSDNNNNINSISTMYNKEPTCSKPQSACSLSLSSTSSSESYSDNDSDDKTLSYKLAIPDTESFFIPSRRNINVDDKQQMNVKLNQQNILSQRMFQSIPNLSDSDSDSESDTSSKRSKDRKRRRSPSSNSSDLSRNHIKIKLSFPQIRRQHKVMMTDSTTDVAFQKEKCSKRKISCDSQTKSKIAKRVLVNHNVNQEIM